MTEARRTATMGSKTAGIRVGGVEWSLRGGNQTDRFRVITSRKRPFMTPSHFDNNTSISAVKVKEKVSCKVPFNQQALLVRPGGK